MACGAPHRDTRARAPVRIFTGMFSAIAAKMSRSFGKANISGTLFEQRSNGRGHGIWGFEQQGQAWLLAVRPYGAAKRPEPGKAISTQLSEGRWSPLAPRLLSRCVGL